MSAQHRPSPDEMHMLGSIALHLQVLHLPFLCLHLRWQHPHYGQVGIRVGRDKAGKVQGCANMDIDA